MGRVAAVGLAVTLVYFAVNVVDVWRAARDRSEPDLEGATPVAAVVLGAAQYNGRPSPVLEGRLDRARELYEAPAVGVIVVTGGNQEGDRTTEAKTGYDYLRSLGVPDEHLRLEVDGRSTYESLAATARFLEREGVSSVVVVTDPFHARRSQLIAEEVGLAADAVVTDVDYSLTEILREASAVSVGRIIGFRRLARLTG